MKWPSSRLRVISEGLAAGLILGLAYAWLIDPVRPTNAYPALLRSDFRREWIEVAALSYVADGDLDLIQSRLSGIGTTDARLELEEVLSSLWETPVASRWESRVQVLAATFGLTLPPTLGSGDAMEGALATVTSPRPVSSSSFRIVQRSHSCHLQSAPRIAITVLDPAGAGIPGVRLWLLWDEGVDWATTGLMPEHGAGYADFLAEPDVPYALGIGDFGLPLMRGLTILGCPVTDDGTQRFGTWQIALEELTSQSRGG